MKKHARIERIAKERNLSPLQKHMAYVLLAINGDQNAIEFASLVPTPEPQQLPLFRLPR